MEQKPICKAYKIICMDKCSYTKLHTLSSELSVLSTVETWLTLSYLNLNLSTITGEVGEGKSERIVTGRFMVAWSVSGGEERRKEEGGRGDFYLHFRKYEGLLQLYSNPVGPLCQWGPGEMSIPPRELAII